MYSSRGCTRIAPEPSAGTGERVDGQLFKQALLGSLSWLTANQEEVNRLNVFPVPDGDPGASIRSVSRAAARAAKSAVEKTPSQLAILREAGVVDAGGYGLQVILEGFLRTVEQGSEEVVAASGRAAMASQPGAAQRNVELPEEGWGYCTEFLVEGSGMAVDDVRDRIAAMGSSALVIGDSELIRVHVHTNEPHKILAYASGLGTLTRTKVDDMSQQHRVILGGGNPPGQDAAASKGAEGAPR